LREGIILFDKIYGNLQEAETSCFLQARPENVINKNLQLVQ